MIIVILQGGLANQMFQYAVGRRLASLRNTKLYLDISWYERADQSDGVGKRVYELAPFAIKEAIYKPTLLRRALIKLVGPPLYVDETQPYVFHEEVLDLPNYARLFGFYQNQKYFVPLRDELIKEFTLKDPATGKNKTLLARIKKDDQSVSVHIRRGDYVSSAAHSEFHGAKGTEYYEQAAAKIRENVKNPTFYVFSDDLAWCKEHIKLGKQTVYVDHDNPGSEDMRLMRACRHNIIANSSFSWWGSWLNQNPNKIVIAPKQWVNNTKVDSSDVVPKEWIRI